jgi:hypothetical protein
MTQKTQKFLSAAADLLQEAISAAKNDDPEGVAGLAACLRAGGLVGLHATFAQSTGLAQIHIEIVEPSGQSHQLMKCELQRQETSL